MNTFTGIAIVCYECNSAINSMCSANILPDSLKKNCSDLDRGVTYTLCRKIIQHVDYETNGQLPMSRVIRSCGWDESRYKVRVFCIKHIKVVSSSFSILRSW